MKLNNSYLINSKNFDLFSSYRLILALSVLLSLLVGCWRSGIVADVKNCAITEYDRDVTSHQERAKCALSNANQVLTVTRDSGTVTVLDRSVDPNQVKVGDTVENHVINVNGQAWDYRSSTTTYGFQVVLD